MIFSRFVYKILNKIIFLSVVHLFLFTPIGKAFGWDYYIPWKRPATPKEPTGTTTPHKVDTVIKRDTVYIKDPAGEKGKGYSTRNLTKAAPKESITLKDSIIPNKADTVSIIQRGSDNVVGKWMKWVFENIKWIFSGIGGLALLAFIGWLSRRKRPVTVLAPPQPGMEEKKAVVERPVHKIDFAEIKNNVKSLPPYQRERVLKEYIGLRIEYTGSLSSVRSLVKGRILIYLRDSLSSLSVVSAEVSEEEFPEFKVMAEGTLVTIVGEIVNFDSSYVELGNITVKKNIPK